MDYNDLFELEMKKFYRKLQENQEYLGKEFEDVLYKNLWELLIRNDF